MSSAESTTLAEDQNWKSASERGSVLGARFVLTLATAFGRWPARLFVRVLAFYYTLFSCKAAQGMNAYLSRIGKDKSFGERYTLIARFAQVTLDALFFLRGKFGHFEITRTGKEYLAELREKKQGAILLGAHVGSMYAMRAQSENESLPLYAVVYTKHAKRINSILDEVAPESQARLLQMGEGVDFMLRIRELIDEGAMIALLGDRVGDDARAVEVDFLGERARLPAGPYLLASVLKCPVYLTFGLFKEPSRYDLYCEPFAEKIELPRGRREEALRNYAQQYAQRLEEYLEKAPDNWFNFYDFWQFPQKEKDDE